MGRRISSLSGRVGGPYRASELLPSGAFIRSRFRILTTALIEFPGSREPLEEFARLAEAQGNYVEAARRWEKVIDNFFGYTEAYARLASALAQENLRHAAYAILLEAERLFPRRDINIQMRYVTLLKRAKIGWRL